MNALSTFAVEYEVEHRRRELEAAAEHARDARLAREQATERERVWPTLRLNTRRHWWQRVPATR